METFVAHLPLGYRLFERSDYQSDARLISEMTAVAAPSYNTTQSLLDREFAHNHLAYFIRDREQQLVAFFLTNFDEINDELISYMGRKIGNHYKLSSDPGNPFIARKLAHDTCYSMEENFRMNQVSRRKNKNILQQFGINETQRDRLIVVVRSLDVEKFMQWSNKLKLDPGHGLQAYEKLLHQNS